MFVYNEWYGPFTGLHAPTSKYWSEMKWVATNGVYVHVLYKHGQHFGKLNCDHKQPYYRIPIVLQGSNKSLRSKRTKY